MPSRILLEASKKGIHLYLNGSELAFKAPQGAMTAELRQSIVQNKQALIALLQSHDKSRAGMPQILPVEGDGPLPLSFAQQRLWLLNQIDGGSTHYNMPNGLRLQGRLDRGAMARAFDTLVERHASLRTCFAADAAGQVRQVVRQDVGCQVREFDFSAFAAGERQLHLAQAMAAEASHPFDLERDLMLRVALVKMEEEEHVLLVTMHHIASDGWSTGILIQEFCTLYRAGVEGKPNPLPPLPVQYTDYAHWQRNWLQGEVFQRELGYWERQLASLPVVHGLPLDAARPTIQGFVGASHTTHLDAATCTALQTLCQAEGGTLFSGLHAAFSVLLARYSNETDIVVGIPTANREQPEIAGLIGFFVNTLVLRSDLSGSPAFRTVLRHSQRVLADAYAHQQVPFEQIVEQLQPERSLSHHPLFQVVMVLQNRAAAAIEAPGLAISALPDESRIAKYDLLLNITEEDDGLDLRWDYNVDLFNADTIARMAGHFGHLLAALLAAPDASVYQVDMLAVSERDRLLSDWRGTGADYPADLCLHELFEAQAARRPDAVAAVCEQQGLTYRELNEQANQLAHYLAAERGVGPDTLVGICLERSLAFVVAILAVLKAGGAYVPLDPDYPAERLDFLRTDAGLATILTDAALLARLPGMAPAAVCLDAPGLRRQLASQPPTNPGARARGVTPHSLAYVIYTSGSTGNPKGVLVEHQNVRRLFDAAAFGFDFGPDDVWTVFHSFAFDFSVWELWGALLNGARLVVVPRWVARSADEFYQLVERERVTVLNQTPGAFYQFSEIDAERAAPLALRYVVFGGEALSLQALQPWVARHGDAAPELINMYGITETTVHVTYRRLHAADLAQAREASVIGRPLADLGVLVLNPAMALAPPGVAGEMYVSGKGLARAYLGRPELTAERFVRDPFAADPAARLYRTGDLVRWTANGELEYVGRIDHQVKVRGFRIELGEIEAALLQQSAVAKAVVLARDLPQRLVAYVVPAAAAVDEAMFVDTLRAALRRQLPDYMVPAAFVVLAALPLTANGKLDRKALPAADVTAQLEAQYCAPESAVEEALCAIWQEVLELARVGVNDNFFALGGDSIRSIRVVALARQQALHFSVKDLFTSQTVRQLAGVLGRTDSAAEPVTVAAFALLSATERARLQARIDSGNLEDAYPLSALQQGMVFHNQMGAEHGLYHDIFSFRLTEPWSEAAFSRALETLMQQNALLRSVISVEHERLLHLIHSELPAPLQVHDLRTVAPAAQDAAVQDWLLAEKTRAFDAGQPLWSVVVHRRSEDCFQYSLSFHHALLDGWSVATLNASLFKLYRDARANVAALPAPHPPYRYFVAAELAGVSAEAAQDYWRAALAQAELPWWTGRPRRHGIEHAPWTLDGAQAQALQDLARTLGVQEKAVFLAAHMVLMGLLNGKAAVTSSVVFNGRPEMLGSERTLGLFLNSLPFHLDSLEASWADLIRKVDRQLLDMTAFRQYPASSVQRDSGLDLAGSLFNYTNFNVYDALQDTLVAEAAQGFEQTNYLLSLSCSKNSHANSYSVSVTADAGVFDAAFLARIEGYLRNILAAIATAPQAPVERARLMGAAEIGELLRASQPEALAFPDTLCAHQLFELQAARTPAATAVIYGNRRLGYEELNKQANRLARYLVREQGVGPDTLVGICAERSPEMMVAILAVLKAGAAYVPLDPDYPAARLAFVLQDAALTLVLTQEHLAGRLGAHTAQMLCLDRPEWQAVVEAESGDNLDPALRGLDATHLAYVLYTSGSTGMPKGVGVVHRGLVNYLCYGAAAYFASVAGAVASSPLAFDATVTSLLAPLVAGKWVDLLIQDGSEVEQLAARLVQATEPTLFKITPAHMDSLAYLVGERALADLPHWFIIGGDQLTTRSAGLWKERLLPQAVLVNEYGPTETVVGCATQIVEHAAQIDRSRAAVPIGRPIANTQLYVVDDQLALTPSGVPGELCIGGAGLARGYLGRDELTAQKFVPNPFHRAGDPASSTRLYRTGDLVRWLPDATLEFLGRIDHQVKIRGFRVELGEIEHALSGHPAVQEALVLARPGADGQRSLVAYVVPAAGAPAAAELPGLLHTHLALALPDYMVPGACVVLEQMPLTANGKVDRNALPAPDLAPLRGPYVAPRTPLETQLCALWQSVLGVEQVGIADNFFQLGGHSLLAMKLVAAIESGLGMPTSVKLVFQFPDVQGLAAYLEVLQPAVSSHDTPAAGAADEEMEVFQL